MATTSDPLAPPGESPLLPLLAEASNRLVRTVDALPEDAWAGPSLLPGWTRAHVVAHLALNAEGLTGCLRGVVRGEHVPMYASDAARDGDIAALAAEDTPHLRERLLASVTELADALALVPADEAERRLERTPGGRTFTASGIPGARLTEVEVHHADLAAGYSPADWPPDHAVHVVESLLARHRLAEGAVLRAVDVDRTWTVGGAGPAVSGTAADLGWWLAGRGDGSTLTSEGPLPRIGAL